MPKPTTTTTTTTTMMMTTTTAGLAAAAVLQMLLAAGCPWGAAAQQASYTHSYADGSTLAAQLMGEEGEVIRMTITPPPQASVGLSSFTGRLPAACCPLHPCFVLGRVCVAPVPCAATVP